MNLENVIKSWFSTLIGCVAMTLAVAGFWMQRLDNIQAIGMFIVGFAMVFMRDRISIMIEKAFAAAIKKFKA